MSGTTIELQTNGIRIRGLDIRSKVVSEYLAGVPEEERELLFMQAAEIGVFCLERAGGARDLEFVRRQVDGLMREVQEVVAALPATLEETIVEKMGDGDGQVLGPIRGLVEHVNASVNERIKGVSDLLAEDLDPTKATSALGGALTRVGELLDPNRKDSIQSVLADAVQQVVNGDGALASTVKACVEESVKPLENEVNRLAQQIAGAQAVEEALQNTTKKGTPYELEVVAELQDWGARMGVIVDHVGCDNKPGDVVVEFPESSFGTASFRIVIEARDRGAAVGRKVVGKELARKMGERNADAAIFLSHRKEGLAKELGDWAEGECGNGAWVATTHEFLLIAIRLLRSQEQLRRRAEALAEVDRAAIQAQIERARTALKLVTNINTNLTHMRTGASKIEEDAEKLRVEIRGALIAIEDALSSPESAEVAA